MNQTDYIRKVRRAVVVGSMCAASAVAAQAQDVEEAPEAPKWDTSASLGATITQGNTDSVLVTASLETKRAWEQNEVKLGVSGAYGERETVDNADKVVDNQNVTGYGQYNRLFNERLYGYGRIDGLHDKIADIDYRFTIGGGLGYYFIKNETTELSAEAGPSYVIEERGGETSEYLGARAAQQFSHKFNANVRIWEKQEITTEVGDLSNYIWSAEVGIEAKMNAKLSLRSYVQNTYVNEPAPGRKSNDLKWITGIGYTF